MSSPRTEGWRERLLTQLRNEREVTVARHAVVLDQLDRSIAHHEAQLAEENEKKNP